MSVFPGSPLPIESLTDAQLRASPVPVSVNGSVTANTGGLTDSQLRANPVEVSVSGVATSANQTTANTSLSSIDGKLPALSSGRVPVDIGGDGSITITSGTVTVSNEVEVTNDTGSPIPVSGTVSSRVAGWDIPLHDYRALGYTSGNLTSVTYKTGGAGGTTVATLTLGYDGSGNLTSLTKT